MRLKCFMIALVILVCAPAIAAAEKLKGSRIQSLLSDSILLADNIEQIFQINGQTIYIEGGNASQGTWFVKGDQYCSTWPPSSQVSCFDVLSEGTEIIFVSSNGKQFVMHLKP